MREEPRSNGEPNAEVSIRRSTDTDLRAVLELLEASLGWVPDDVHERFFTWKHDANPAGHSPGWVAVDERRGGRIVGFRTFMRWTFERDGQALQAVRAVDTATHPDYQGLGIFSRLTLTALEDLRRAGVAFVFNTPNEKSLPGYLKMGWQVVGRLPVGLRPPRSPARLTRVLRSRTAADKWSLPTDAGRPASEVFADRDAVSGLVATTPGGGLRTSRTPEFLAWRYGFEPLGYRVLSADEQLHEGVIVFRVRRRGTATELTVVDVLVPANERRRAAGLVKRALATSGADYALALRPAAGFVAFPRQGPLLVWRALGAPDRPPKRDWAMTLGDIELF